MPFVADAVTISSSSLKFGSPIPPVVAVPMISSHNFVVPSDVTIGSSKKVPVANTGLFLSLLTENGTIMYTVLSIHIWSSIRQIFLYLNTSDLHDHNQEQYVYLRQD